MRLMELNLLAVGPFTDVSLDLSGGHEGVHVIYGDNEAGKSSALRALRALFFGFHPQTTDTFLHDGPNLRVRARLKRSDGAELSIVRRKGRQQTLLDASGTPVTEEVLESFLGTVTEELFDTFFGINHESLVTGGRDLLASGGKVGEALLSAGAGGQRLRDMLTNFGLRADELFKRGGRNQKIAMALAALEKANDTVHQISLSGQAWAEQEDKRSGAITALEQLKERRHELQRRQGAKSVLLQAIPTLDRRRSRLDQITAMGAIPELGPQFSSRRQRAEAALSDAQGAMRETAEQLSFMESSRAGIEVRDEVLAESELIEGVHGRLQAYRSALASLPQLEVERDATARQAAEMLARLRPGLDLEKIEQCRLGQAQRVQIEQLAGQWRQIDESVRLHEGESGSLAEQMAEVEAELARLGELADVSALEAALGRVKHLEIGEKALAKLRGELEALEARVKSRARRLKPGNGSWEDLAALAAPADETIALHEKALADQEKARARLQEKLAQADEELAQTEREIESQRLQGPVPSVELLEIARRRRDTGWELLRKVWLEGNREEQETGEFAGEKPLDAAYEASVREADAVADALRLDAQRVARHAQLMASRQALEQARAKHQADLIKLDESQEQAVEQWRAAWAGTGIEPLTPAEMRTWRREQQGILEMAEQIAAGRRQVGQAQQALGALIETFSQAMQGLGERVSDGTTLAELVEHAQDVVKRIVARKEKRGLLEQNRHALGRRLERAKNALAQVNARLAQWREQWAKAVHALLLSPDTLPESVQKVIAEIDELFRLWDRSRQAADGLRAAQQGVEAFSHDAQALAGRLMAGEPEMAPDRIAAALWRLLAGAREAQTQRQSLDQQLESLRDTLRRMTANRVAAMETLNELCALARCDEVGALPAIEAQDQRRQELRKQVQADEDALLALGSGRSVEELDQQARQLDPDDLKRELEEIEAELRAIDEQIGELNAQKGAAEESLRQMDGREVAAIEQQNAQSLAAQAAELSGQYVRWKVAAELLGRAIERYRKHRQDPLLGRAGEIFAQLTEGAFAELEAEADGDRAVLLAVRAGNGKRVTVEGMSDGTRDQLYLALRIASLEQHISSAEPFPFIVDDILINFDDRRSRATIEVLAELSARTQVILFTHEKSLATMAKHAAPGKVFVRELGEGTRDKERTEEGGVALSS